MGWKETLTDTVRNISDKARDLGDNLGEKARDLGDNLGEKARDLGENIGDKLEISKIKSQIGKLEKEISNNYESIGVLYYQQTMEKSISETEIQRLCSSISDLKKDIAALEEKIAAINED